jgi:hypothetical protein
MIWSREYMEWRMMGNGDEWSGDTFGFSLLLKSEKKKREERIENKKEREWEGREKGGREKGGCCMLHVACCVVLCIVGCTLCTV